MDALDRLREELDRERVGGMAGFLAMVTAFGSIVIAILLSPSFSWSGSALSDLGAPSSSVSLIFNTGMILAGLFGLVFGIYMIRETEIRGEWLSIGLFNLSMFGLSLVGVFPIGSRWHRPVSFLFFASFTYALLLWGTATVRKGRIHTGTTAIWMGILHASAWAAWVASLQPWLGIAVPETVGAVILGLWTISQSLVLLDRRSYLPLPDQ